MKTNFIFTLFLIILTLSLSLISSNLLAKDTKENNIDILIQENDITVTRQEALSMIAEMNWAQKQNILKNEDKFQGLLLNYLTLKKQVKEAEKRKLHETQLVKWKMQRQNAQLLATELLNDFQKNIDIPESIEAVAREYYNANPEKYKIKERVGVSHILLAIKADANEETIASTLEKAKTIIEEIKNGLNFETAAKKYSDDKGSARDGGNINPFLRGRMVPPFEKAAFSMKTIGEISPPIKTRFGYHIIKLTSRIEAGMRPFSDVGPLLVKKERDLFLKNKTDAFLTQFNATKNTTVYLPALQLLRKEESNKLVDPFKKSK